MIGWFIAGLTTGVVLVVGVLWMAWAVITRDEKDLERE